MNRTRYALGVLMLSAAFASEAVAQCNSDQRMVAGRGIQPNRPAGPVAWSGDRLGVVLIENETRALFFVTYSEQFAQLSDTVELAPSSVEDSLFLFWNGVDYGLFYRTPDNELVLQRISPTGTPIGGRIFVTPSHGFFAEDEIDITWDPYRESYLVVRTITQGPEKGMWLSQIDRDGTVRLDRTIYFFVAVPTHPEVVAASDKSVAVFFVHQFIPGVTMVRVTPDNANVFPVQISSVTPKDMVVASAGDRYGIVKWMDVTGGKTEMRWQVVSPSGTTLVTDRSLFTPRGVDVRPVDLIRANNEWALLYVDSIFGFRELPGDLRLRRFTDSGALNSDTLFSADRLRSSFLTRYPPVWTGTSYLTGVALRLSRFEGSDSYLIRHCPLTGRAQANVEYTVILAPVTFQASAFGGSPEYTYEWDYGDTSRTQFGPTVTHTYDRPGVYTVTLTTTDIAGARHVTTTSVRILADVRRRSVRK